MVGERSMTYNHEKYIPEALKSIHNQKSNILYNLEINDDRSTGETCTMYCQCLWFDVWRESAITGNHCDQAEIQKYWAGKNHNTPFLQNRYNNS